MAFAFLAYVVGYLFYRSPLMPHLIGVDRLALGFGFGMVTCLIVEIVIAKSERTGA